MVSDVMLFLVTIAVQLVNVAIVLPISILVVLPCLAFNFWLSYRFSKGLGFIGRLESSLSSPCYAIFQESLEGLVSIRATEGGAEEVSDEHCSRVQALVTSSCTRQTCFRWMRIRAQLGAVTMMSLIILGSLFIAKENVTLIGLAISFAWGLGGVFTWGTSVKAHLDAKLPNVERIRMYCDLPEEKYQVEDDLTTFDWPNSGKLEFDNVTMGYENSAPVLKNVSFKVESGEKVGIVGRTGAGKSSLITCLFRLVEVEGVILDGLHTQNVPLDTLRTRCLSIISQDPFLFSGTLRSNVDPFNAHTDEEVLSALDKSSLSSLSLDHVIEERGDNLSLGQKQLVCLARAMMRESPILVMDEATASCDPETDDLIQRTIRSTFKDRTLLTIAHRLNTIIDSDRVLVMDDGMVAEYDTPEALMSNPNGLFKAYVEASKHEHGETHEPPPKAKEEKEELFSVDWLLQSAKEQQQEEE